MRSWGFYAGLALFGVFIFLISKLVRKSGGQAQMEEREAGQRRQVEAVQREAHLDRETLGSMADADAASVSDTVDSARERMRTRNPRNR